MVIDLPEQGRSSKDITFSIESSAEMIIELLKEKANGKSIILIGFSLGAQVVIQILSMEQNLIVYAMINSALVRPMALIRKLIRPSVKLTYPFIKMKTFSKLQAKTLYVDKEYFEIYYKETSQMKSATLIRILEENMSFEIPKHFKEANAKLLVTVGGREKSIMRKSAIDIVSNNPNCTGVIIPKVGHGISLAEPNFFNEMLENWIINRSLPQRTKIIDSIKD